jgi:hypothetical protein
MIQPAANEHPAGHPATLIDIGATRIVLRYEWRKGYAD